eukprot:TRINITY_DN2959_c0_g1_i1.p1 TRINITY_DN2959_c0_g1~~TRINITY_DN2959_c0_g1_i1.p1  ORF type:complete len:662 (+),score=200.86 TRINITY_DN2959_c0_g1_i1:143-2128(+)
MAEAASSTAAKTSTPADSTLVGYTTTSSTAQGTSGAAVQSKTDATSNPSTSANASAPSGNASSADPAESKVALQGPELKQALLNQIDYTFSREYLSTDYSIVSQMNGDLFLPLSFVYELPYFKQLTTDTAAILDALKSSSKVVLDLAASLVRPNFKLQRNTIILRDIPSEYTDKEVRGLFDDEKITSQITDVKKDIENTWFVTLASEDVTMDAFLHVRQKKINGNPVQGRVKSENLLKSTYTPTYYATNPYAYQQYAAQGQYQNGYQPRNGQNGSYGQARNYDRNYDASGKKRGGFNGGQNSRRGAQGGQNFNGNNSRRTSTTPATAPSTGAQTQQKIQAPASQTAAATTQNNSPRGSNQQQQQAGGKRTGASSSSSQTGNRTQQTKPARQQGQPASSSPKISSADFPPLSRIAAGDIKQLTKEQLLAMYGAAINGSPASSSAGMAADDLSAFETSSTEPPKPQFLVPDAPVLVTAAQEPELSKPAANGVAIKADMLETTISKRRSSSSGSQGRPPSAPRQRPEQPQLTAAQVAAANANKLPPLPPTAASVVASSTKKPVTVTSAAKQPAKPKETKSEAPKATAAPAAATAAPAAAPAKEAPKSTGPSWSDIAKAQAAAAAAAKAQPKQPAAKSAAAAAPAAGANTATPSASSSSAAPASN